MPTTILGAGSAYGTSHMAIGIWLYPARPRNGGHEYMPTLLPGFLAITLVWNNAVSGIEIKNGTPRINV